MGSLYPFTIESDAGLLALKHSLDSKDEAYLLLASTPESYQVTWASRAAYEILDFSSGSAPFIFIDCFAHEYEQSIKEFEEGLRARSFDQTLTLHGLGKPTLDIMHIPFKTSASEERFLLQMTVKDTSSDTQRKLESTLLFENVAEHSHDVVIRYDCTGRRMYANKAFEKVTGVTIKNAIGRTPREYSGVGASADYIQKLVESVVKTQTFADGELSHRAPNGTRSIFDLHGIPELSSKGEVESVVLIGRDITDKKRTEEQMRLSESRFRSLVENSPDLIARFDAYCRLLYANPVLARMSGTPFIHFLGLNFTDIERHIYTKQEEIPKHVESPIDESMRQVLKRKIGVEIEYEIPSLSGSVNCLVSLTPEFGERNELVSVLVVCKDMSEVKRYQEQVRYLSYHDSLTGLPNRATFLNDVRKRLIVKNNVATVKLGLIVLGLDHFKGVNDSLGYEYGDLILQGFSNRLRDILPKNAIIARLGGDEFAALLPTIPDREEFVCMVTNISGELSLPIGIGSKEMSISISTGACLYPDDAFELDSLVRYADSALYAAKHEQRGSVRFYTPELTKQAQERLQLRNDLRRALDQREFVPYYQPKFDLLTNEVLGAEALVRWNHPEKGLISPFEFIPVLEEMGLVEEVDMMMLDMVCGQLEQWQHLTDRGGKIAVNFSGLQFKYEKLLEKVVETVESHNLTPKVIQIEVTEGVLLEHHDLLPLVFKDFKALGFSIALDDFGTGYSSLGYLSKYPIDTLKIDRSFVNNINKNEADDILIKTIVSMAQNLKMDVVAEGVETKPQADWLASIGVRIVQGYLFGRPMSSQNFEALFLHDDGIVSNEIQTSEG
ncbi:bifunctional diguanylate cyclase/phosphodiesterase [Marinomonas balearica]|uniref:PAS domain S-box-containing protein/diguanylate cyclase (GGDEF)-like protein n=1 Tax=Marinomonas balearica TaxID=491947 RepID=A0A4R6MB05_9GAMM|nr:bifunctional diguanylate cyclase/phosphodiesterase [Marinomonas balearica]TDO98751.1 PAS domain S-box-containing protein/diguanylate cyclase (GGDEF)-like protein [Marinomonas balearica]